MTDFQIRPIRNDENHRASLMAIEGLWDAEPDTEAYDSLDLLTTLVEAYEGKRWPVADLDPIEAIEAALESGAHDRRELADLIGDNRVSEVLGSGLTDQSQKMTVAASATAEKKTVGQRS